MSRRLWFVELAALLALASPLGCGAPGASPPSSSAGAARPADFELPRLDGGSERLSAHFGRDVVLLDFWATFCEPCLRAMPELDALYRARQAQGFVVLGISIDGPSELAAVQREVSKLGVTFPILLDSESRVVSLYNPRATAPFSVLIGRDGRVLTRREGYVQGAHGDLERDVDAALAAR